MAPDPNITIRNESGSTRRRRKQPLLALGDKRIGTDFNDSSTSRQLLQASTLGKDAQVQLFAELREQLHNFLSQGGLNWKEGETCRRFTIFGDCITIANWKDEALVSGYDVVKTVLALYRVEHFGKYPKDRKKFEEGIASDLRNLKLGSDALLEEASSPLLKFLFRISSVRTHKRQKIFKWNVIPFKRLYADSLEKSGNRQTGKIHDTFHNGQLLAKRQHTKLTVSSPNSWGSPPSDSALSPGVESSQFSDSFDGDTNIEFSEFCKLAFVADMMLARMN